MREFSEEEKLQVMHSENFQLFIDHSSRLVERAFASDRDLFIDYKVLESKGDPCGSLDWLLGVPCNHWVIYCITFIAI